VPARWRGMVSGLLQSGYPSGYLLASLLFLAEPALGWRGMFVVGALPALLVFYIRRNVPESPDWQKQETRGAHDAGVGVLLRRHGLLALYGIVLMTCFNFFSHGSQDLYPKLFLVKQHHLSHGTVTAIMIVYNLGAMTGGLLFGWLSQRLGRRWAMALAALLALPVIPLWAFSHGAALLCLGGFLIQLCVQGAWGVVPAYLNEISPPALRATFPGTVYQLGNLIAACNANLQLHIAAAAGGDLRWAMAGVVGTVAVVIAVLAVLGRETRQVRMGRELA
jgi:MFS transporter, SHS family, lactate transporter